MRRCWDTHAVMRRLAATGTVPAISSTVVSRRESARLLAGVGRFVRDSSGSRLIRPVVGRWVLLGCQPACDQRLLAVMRSAVGRRLSTVVIRRTVVSRVRHGSG